MKDRAALIAGLQQAPGILEAFVASVAEDKLHRRRGTGFWTVAEHVSHLAQVQPMLLERLARFGNEAFPVFVPFIPGADSPAEATVATMDMAAALAQFARLRQSQVALIAGADDAIWAKQASHPEYDAYSFHILVRHILMHDHWHMYRMEELWLTKDAYLTALK